MKLIKFNIFISLILLILFSSPSFLFAEVEEKTENTYPLDRDGKVYVENVSGDIIVKSWQKNEIKILARKAARDRNLFDKVHININRTDSNIRIITRYDKPAGMYQSADVSVYYDIFIPDRAQLRIKTVSGNVEAREIGGPVEAETISGKIDIVSAGQGVKCKSISGLIYLDGISGGASLKTTSGKITADGIKGSIDANSVSGDIGIKDFSLADGIDMETIKGNMGLQGVLSPGGIYEFRTISGRIRLILAPDSNFELQTNTVSGEVHCDFKLNEYAVYTRNRVQGTVGKGGSSLNLSSVSGDILINKRN
jgi:DUF4097 and DUF4098 domain-containing protein YvlB